MQLNTAYFRRKAIGPMMESVVAVELVRGLNYGYLRINDYEVDFVINREPREYVRVTYASAMDEIDRREFRALARASEALGRGIARVITWDLCPVPRIPAFLIILSFFVGSVAPFLGHHCSVFPGAWVPASSLAWPPITGSLGDCTSCL